MMANHLAWPIRFDNGHLATVEQDTIDEVTQCVQLLWQIPSGWFIHDPDLGVENPVFSELPLDIADLAQAAEEFEDRAVVEFTTPEDQDELAAQGEARVPVRISLTEEA